MKIRSSFNPHSGVIECPKRENEENNQNVSEKPASRTEENGLEFQEKIKHIDSELEGKTYLKNASRISMHMNLNHLILGPPMVSKMTL